MLYRNFQFTPADYITIVSHDIYIRNPKTLYTNKDADRNKEIDRCFDKENWQKAYDIIKQEYAVDFLKSKMSTSIDNLFKKKGF